ncbi:uncharacterized protein [Drosophila takahashii]|uniref:uncharacterized protein n=1 Tax=Drosophila takahashii TaxID=29030 RepID=UPI001CF92DD0|nr:uncharacterized protein LOC108066041 [Drosophila takahashii]
MKLIKRNLKEPRPAGDENGAADANSVSSTTAATTTIDPLTKLDKETTDELQNILNKYERECIGNSEFSSKLDAIRSVIKLDQSRLKDKILAEQDFKVYNQQRIDLEKQINDRIDELNNILPKLDPNSSCSQFHLKQRDALKKAKELSNIKKQDALRENSKLCSSDTDYDPFYYIY